MVQRVDRVLDPPAPLNSEYGGGATSPDRLAGYVHTELTDVEHEAAGMLTAHREPQDFGGLRPSDANAETVLIMDVIPSRAGTDIPLPSQNWTLGVHSLTTVPHPWLDSSVLRGYQRANHAAP